MKLGGKRPSEANPKATPKREKLSLYPLSIEDALRAAAKTGRPPKDERPKRKPKAGE
jgi:hypothetical protein